MKHIYPFILLLAIVGNLNAQLTINNATFIIQSGATVIAKGNITSNADIQGTGLLSLQGDSLQNIDMGGYSIPNLELYNINNAALLNSNARIGNSLLLSSGKLLTGNLNLYLGPTTTVTGQGSNNFISINGTGQLIKELNADITNFQMPVGENSNYRPALLSVSGASYAAASFGLRVVGNADPNKPASIASYLNTSWPVTQTGISGGSITLTGQYTGASDVTGNQSNIAGYYFNGTNWSSAGESHTPSSNQITAVINSSSGSVSGFNKFLLVGARAFLQGAYDPVSGLMTDNLRSLPFGAASSISNFPSTDPYRESPYNAAFTHVNNFSYANRETIPSATVLATQANVANNIVDWVFLELRDLTPSPGNNVLQTRSALIQRDGDIVDVDGISPVTFNNLPNGNYILTVRHRNHLGMSFAQASPMMINETNSTAYTTNAIDFRTAAQTSLYGTASNHAIAAHPSLTVVNLLYAGNANSNGTVKFINLSNDKDYLLNTILSGNPGASLLNVYSTGDLNMNKNVKFINLGNDKDFLLNTVLGGSTSGSKTQAIPN